MSHVNLQHLPVYTEGAGWARGCLYLAHRDGRRLDGQPSLSGYCGHGPIFIVQRSVANDPKPPYGWGLSCQRPSPGPAAQMLPPRIREKFSHLEPGQRINRLFQMHRRRVHSGLIPADLITLAHLSVSSAIIFANAVGDKASGVAPRSESWALIWGSASTALTSRLSLSMTAIGVFRGAPKPCHALAS